MSSDTLRVILREIAREEARAAVRDEFAALLSEELLRPAAPSRRHRARNSRRGWTESDKLSLVSDIRHGMTIHQAAEKYGRTTAAIRDRLYHQKWGLLRHEKNAHDDLVTPRHLL